MQIELKSIIQIISMGRNRWIIYIILFHTLKKTTTLTWNSLFNGWNDISDIKIISDISDYEWRNVFCLVYRSKSTSSVYSTINKIEYIYICIVKRSTMKMLLIFTNTPPIWNINIKLNTCVTLKNSSFYITNYS